MATTNLNIRTDKEVKDKAEEIFSELGLNMTTAVTSPNPTTVYKTNDRYKCSKHFFKNCHSRTRHSF